MINFLDRVSEADSAVQTLHLGTFYTWAVLDGCDSCMEKVIYGQAPMKYPFTLSNLLECVPDLRYEIAPHQRDYSHEPVAMRKLEHIVLYALL